MALINKGITNSAQLSTGDLDIFLYDTSTDSDGGAWTKRCRHTSWYKSLGSDFPKIALITVGSSTLKIYDATKADTPLWYTCTKLIYWGGNAFKVKAKNGLIIFVDQSTSNNHGLGCLDFTRDMHVSYDYSDGNPFIDGGTVTTDNNSGIERYSETPHPLFRDVAVRLDGRFLYDMDLAVHPDTPIEPDTGLPLPSIAWCSAGPSGVNFIMPFREYSGGYNVLSSVHHLRKTFALQWTSTAYYFTSCTWSANGRDIVLGIEYEPAQNYDNRYMYVPDVINYDADTTTNININNLNRSSNPSIWDQNKWSSSDPYQSRIADHIDNIMAFSEANSGVTLFRWGGEVDNSWVARLQDQSSFNYTHAGVAIGECAGYNTGWLQKNQVFALAESSDSPSTYYENTSLINNTNQESFVSCGASGTGVAFQAAGDTPRATWKACKPFTNYRLAFTVSNASNATMYIDDDAASLGGPGTQYVTNTSISNGNYEYCFKTTRSPKIRMINTAGTGGSFTIDNIILTEVPSDRSSVEHNLGTWGNNSISIRGNINSTPVSTGSDTHYLTLNNNSSIKLLYQPYRQLGLTYTVMWWGRYTTDQTWDLIMSLSSVSNGNHGGGIGFRDNVNAESIWVTNYQNSATVKFTHSSDGLRQNDHFHHYCITCDGTNGTRCFIDGVESSRDVVNNINLSLPATSDAFYTIGSEGPTQYNSSFIDGRDKDIAMFRMSRYPTSLAMARWIVQQERPLFSNEGSKSIPLGAASSMDYDYHTRTLHCGSGGLGSYKIRGLEVLDIDTSVQGDKITASNDLVFKRD